MAFVGHFGHISGDGITFFWGRDYPFFFLAHIPNTISYVWRTQNRVGTSKYIKLYRVSVSMQADRRESMQVDSKKNCKITILRALGKIFTIDSGQKGGAGSHLYQSNELTSYYNMPNHEKYTNMYFRRESI